MRFFLTVALLAVSVSSFAQKREIQKIEKALQSNDFAGAKEIFATIDANSVEEKYQASYDFTKGMLLLGSAQNSLATLDQIHLAKAAFDKAKELGYDKQDQLLLGKQIIQNRLFTIAQERLETKDIEGTAVVLEELYLMDANNLAYASDAANMYYASGNFDKALTYYQLLFDKGYTGVRTQYFGTNVASGKKIEYTDADTRAKDLKIGILENPSEENTTSVVGDMVLKLVYIIKKNGDSTKAKELFNQAQQKFPDDLTLKVATPDIYLQLDMLDEYKTATENLTDGIKDPVFFDKLAFAAQEKSMWDEVIKNYGYSLEINEDNFPALVNISNAYIQKGNNVKTYKEQMEKYTAAVGYLEKALVIDAKDENVTNTLLQLYEILKMDAKLAALKSRQ